MSSLRFQSSYRGIRQLKLFTSIRRYGLKPLSCHFPHPYRFISRMTTSAAATASAIETAKKHAAIRAVKDHFDPKAEYVGIGSGSTIVYVVEAIQALPEDLSHIKFVPTGYQSRQVIVQHGLTPIAFDSLPPNRLIDVAFDGADEVDEDLNCIKGGGACLYQEKLVASHSKKFICVAGTRPKIWIWLRRS